MEQIPMNPSAPCALLLACALAGAAANAWAQTAAPVPRPSADPLHAQTPVPAAVAPAPFAHYQRHHTMDMQPGAWRAANEAVNRIGGWRAYAREAQSANPAPTPPAATAAHRAVPQGLVPAPAVPAAPTHRH
jgi:hypothetical protein